MDPIYLAMQEALPEFLKHLDRFVDIYTEQGLSRHYFS